MELHSHSDSVVCHTSSSWRLSLGVSSRKEVLFGWMRTAGRVLKIGKSHRVRAKCMHHRGHDGPVGRVHGTVTTVAATKPQTRSVQEDVGEEVRVV